MNGDSKWSARYTMTGCWCTTHHSTLTQHNVDICNVDTEGQIIHTAGRKSSMSPWSSASYRSVSKHQTGKVLKRTRGALDEQHSAHKHIHIHTAVTQWCWPQGCLTVCKPLFASICLFVIWECTGYSRRPLSVAGVSHSSPHTHTHRLPSPPCPTYAVQVVSCITTAVCSTRMRMGALLPLYVSASKLLSCIMFCYNQYAFPQVNSLFYIVYGLSCKNMHAHSNSAEHLF